MYEYIKGTFAGINKDYVIIENNGIGYKIYTSGSTMAKMPSLEEEVLLYLQQIVREDFIGLYGFLTKDEINMFNLILTINGVGAKAALSLLSISNVSNLRYAILTGDEKTLMRAPGIGKKIAQRIILELKDKLSIDNSEANDNLSLIKPEGSSSLTEASQALIALGYTDKEVEKVLNNINPEDSIENIIKRALKMLMN